MNNKNRILQFFNPFSFQSQIYKIYINLDLSFYLLSYEDKIPHITILEEDNLYDIDIKGIPSFLNFQIPGTKNYNSLIDVDRTRLKKGDLYAELKYNHDQFIQTKFVLNLQSLTLNSIDIFDHKGRLIARANENKLRQIGFLP